VIDFLHESSHQDLGYLLVDWVGPRPNLQGMLDDYPRDARYVTGPPCKYVFIHAKEVDERVFLFLQEGHTTLPSTSWVRSIPPWWPQWVQKTLQLLGIRGVLGDALMNHDEHFSRNGS
jgi:hypothetical protein